MADEGQAERQHAPSDKRRREFAERGEVAQSRELMTVAALLAGCVMLFARSHAMLVVMISMMQRSMQAVEGPMDPGLYYQMGSVFMQVALPVVASTALAALGMGFLQHRGVPPLRLIQFDLSRLMPGSYFAKLFNLKKTGTTLLSSAVKAVLLAVLIWFAVATPLHRVISFVPASLAIGLNQAETLMTRVVARSLLMLVALGVLDYGLAWWRLEQKMRMSMQQLRDEAKDESGDPQTRQRRRKMAQAAIKQRSLAEVPNSDVVIVNPTHVAVAVVYRAKQMQAPIVVAKGQDQIAERIRQIARQHGVAVVSQPPLARLIYKQVKVGKPIPEDLYQAVAVVLAHVYKRRGKAA